MCCFPSKQKTLNWALVELNFLLIFDFLFFSIAAFSGKNSYKKSQFIPITLHNDSKHEWIVFKVQHYEPRDPFLAQEQLAKLEKACVPLMASPNVGLIGPGQDVVFKLILPDRNIWPVSR
ncbi:unnamed protein product [Meloidogyne enterolobii]|uniref:Uncharacterized protein n=1 Tax=Meloidogyne enterolobii TaxID=390850 RepID=A0ACB0Z2Y1_MELEN